MNQTADQTAFNNLLWGEKVADFFYQNRIQHVFFSPGSRSTPLILALERKKGIECIPVLDERTASFAALGRSKLSQQPTALLCTSGSAPTHWFPAVTEAHYSSIPLFLLTADRPPELQNCGAGQTIDQYNLFEKFVRGFHQSPLPDSSTESVNKLTAILKAAYRQTLGKNPGPVQINFPFREPLFPEDLSTTCSIPTSTSVELPKPVYKDSIEKISAIAKEFSKVLLIAGEFAPTTPILSLLSKFPIPTICDALSPLRHCSCTTTILRYEHHLRNPSLLEKLKPELIIVLGPLPTSKKLRSWIDQTNAKRIIIEPRGIKVDPLTSESTSFELDFGTLQDLEVGKPNSAWVQAWLDAEQYMDDKIQAHLDSQDSIHEAKLARTLSLALPDDAVLHVANSMPIRDLEWFWKKGSTNRKLFGNRGVNGIDGTLGTSLGLAHQSKKPTFLLTGELAFLHDSNALLFSDYFCGSLTVILVNNHGGGIFHHLPISKQDEFKKCFVTPQNCNFCKLCEAHEVEYHLAQTWEEISQRISIPFAQGIRVIEIPVNPEHSVQKRNDALAIQ
jgi:2-succinyl-5-enolpyruvyl-6-hydroxy-3-cyclohexene-1-carboxylate synthase